MRRLKKQSTPTFWGVFSDKAALKKMSDAKSGVIINTGSISGERAVPRMPGRILAKAGVAMSTKSIAVEYARQDIRCNCTSPGIVNSNDKAVPRGSGRAKGDGEAGAGRLAAGCRKRGSVYGI